MLRAIVLGAGAGGGFPQWNSAGPGCQRARTGDPRAKPRSQASLAVSADGERWLLVNASPDLRAQIAATPALHPRPEPLRNSPIAAVALTGAEVDTIAGLLNLRERQAFRLYGAAPSLALLDENPIFRALNPDFVTREAMPLGTPFAPCDGHGAPLGLTIEAYPVPGKVPLFAEGAGDPGLCEDGEALGLAISAGGAVLHYIPGCAMMTDALRQRLMGAACVMFDGTLFTDDEMILAGAGPKTGRRMGHMSMVDTVQEFAALGVARRIFIHINNTNPALLDDSPERAQLAAAGWEVAEDRMEISL
ncbi:pyrroloquinoline quinone biosynthesis protein PqqB [Roseococcus sp. SDR]|uniref:pyrroloquinoline quinone biosynthesis protein PqqB n=1 Tax=Roseococcus sp. SDR TaxID=2835532 RepID=UPI001BCD558F|nr:pyrroloquinoline quinone biosynthesis protein PqqB [Roseococcus sp. SDR]MBS7791603.1 pyrroloquinoline quinone biosynthesis protein PqqB [Roseococcus sp. SDR]MBV1846917.1 pyrroloquinoline quinone biosynthesis protein PqqB [Roseococcus sp. SDR]